MRANASSSQNDHASTTGVRQTDARKEDRMADAAEMLWVVLANVSGGDWTQQSAEWQEAAARWRDHYFAVLSS